MRMIEVAAAAAPIKEIHYTGIDLFEARSPSDGPGPTLKRAYRLLQATGARVQLAPGDPFTALARTANSLGPTDLVILSHQQDRASLARAWFYLPRVLHANSLVLAEQGHPSGELTLRQVFLDEIERMARVASGRRAA